MAKVDPPRLKVYYFDIPGKAEAIRLACAYGNLNWEDVRMTKDEFMVMKESGKLSFGQVPALGVIVASGDSDAEGKETMLFQSAAIMRYVGKHAGLYPLHDDIKAAQIDAIVDQEADIFAGLSVSRYRERFGFGFMTDADVAASRKSLNDDVLPRHLSNLEKLLECSDSGWIAGGEFPTIADFILAPRLKWLVEPGVNDGISESLLDGFPRVKAMIAKFESLPAVVKYYSNKK